MLLASNSACSPELKGKRRERIFYPDVFKVKSLILASANVSLEVESMQEKAL